METINKKTEEPEEDDEEPSIDIVADESEEDEDEGDIEEAEGYEEHTSRQPLEIEEDEDDREVLKITDGSREIFLSSCKSNLKELKLMLLELLKESEVKTFLCLNNNKQPNYLG